MILPAFQGVSSKPSAAAAGDPYFANVVSLLHFDGNLTDEKGLTWTGVGNAAATGGAKFGSNALALDGVGDNIATANSGDFTWGTGDFTIECWVYNTKSGYQFIMGNNSNTSGNFMLAINVPISGSPQVGFGAASVAWPVQFNNGVAFPQNEWVHLAVCRQGENNYCYINGIQVDTTKTDSRNWVNAAEVRIGSMSGAATADFGGLIDDLRITKGVARYTTNFTPPTAAFPDA